MTLACGGRPWGQGCERWAHSPRAGAGAGAGKSFRLLTRPLLLSPPLPPLLVRLLSYVTFAVEVDPERPVLVDKYLDRAVELDVDALCDVQVGPGGAVGQMGGCGARERVCMGRDSGMFETEGGGWRRRGGGGCVWKRGGVVQKWIPRMPRGVIQDPGGRVRLEADC